MYKTIVLMIALMLPGTIFPLSGEHAPEVRIKLDSGHRAISPYIYGTNRELQDNDGYTARRLGGNRMTGYNWTTNYSNAGSDWKQSSDDFLIGSEKTPLNLRDVPAGVIRAFHERSRKLKAAYSLITLQLAGFVAADKDGTVSESETAPSRRWQAIFPSRDSELARTAGQGVLQDALYLEDLVSLLIKHFGTADKEGGIRAYGLDNEPALWQHTHPRIHPLKPTCEEVVQKGIQTARMVKRLDPQADIVGPSSFGFSEFNDNQGAPDWDDLRFAAQEEGKLYGWYLDYYLDQFNQASQKTGTRLLNALSLHWYSEARGGGERITDQKDFDKNPMANRARMQAPRSLWDPAYHEDSWIGRSFSWGLPLIPRVQESIDEFYPGTRIAFTEYNYGGGTHISGGIAQADVLGIFGRQGVYLATFWPLGGKGTYFSAAFKIYRNYDGKGSTFGDTGLEVQNSDIVRSSVYASIDGTDKGRIHLVVINKHETEAMTPRIVMDRQVAYAVQEAWGFNASEYRIKTLDTQAKSSPGRLEFTVPPLSVTHLVLQAQ